MLKKIVLTLAIIISTPNAAYATTFHHEAVFEEPPVGLFAFLVWTSMRGAYIQIKSGSMLSQVDNIASAASQLGTSYNTNTKLSALRMFSFSMYAMDFKPATDVPIRLESEFGMKFINMDKATSSLAGELQSNDAKLFSIMLNLYYDFYFNDTIVPYLTTGIGYAGVADNNLEGLAWNVGTGITISLNERIKFDTGLKYFNVGKSSSLNDFKGNYASEIANRTKAGYASIDAMFGFRFVFLNIIIFY